MSVSVFAACAALICWRSCSISASFAAASSSRSLSARACASSCCRNFSASLTTSARLSGAWRPASVGSNAAPGRHRRRIGGVAERRPHHHVVQLAQHVHRGPGGMGWTSWTARLPSLRIRFSFCPMPTPTRRWNAGSLIRAERSSLYGIGKPVDVVDQPDELLRRPAGVEARRREVGGQIALSAHTVGVDLRPLGPDEVEVAQRVTPREAPA